MQHRRNTCCPLSTHKPSRRNEKVAPPSRGRASRSVTRAPPSTHDTAAARPARPPPTTITRGASAGVTAGPPPGSARPPTPSPTPGARSGRRTPMSAEDVEVFAERGEVLRRYQAEGCRLLGLSWQPEIAEEKLSSADVDAVFVRMRELLGVAIDRVLPTRRGAADVLVPETSARTRCPFHSAPSSRCGPVPGCRRRSARSGLRAPAGVSGPRCE